MTANKGLSSKQLLTLIGHQLVYQEDLCEIIEILDECELVLQVLESESSIQATQYGEGHRTVPMTYILPLYDGEGELHAEIILAGIEPLLIA